MHDHMGDGNPKKGDLFMHVTRDTRTDVRAKRLTSAGTRKIRACEEALSGQTGAHYWISVLHGPMWVLLQSEHHTSILPLVPVIDYDR